jgi:hypothetical protein
LKINKVDDIFATDEGIKIYANDETILISWDVIDIIAEVSEPHYQQQVIKEIAIMNSQKKIN